MRLWFHISKILKTFVGGKCMSKTKAFHIMASHLRNVAGFPDVTGEEMKKRFERYVAMYKKARGFKDSTGQGLSEKELEKGMTIEDKLEKICPHFGRMHTILGQRANIAPPAEESAGLPSDAEDADMIISDSQAIEEDDGNWKEDDDFGEGLTAVEEEHSPAVEEEHSPSVMQVEGEEGINLVDASYGSDDDDDIIGNQTEEEDPNEGFQDEINNTEQTRSEQEGSAAETMEGSATETRHEQPAEGRSGRNVDDSRGKSTSNNRGNGSRSGESAVTRSLGRDNKANLMDLYEEGLRNKLEFRKAFIDYRYASLAEKRAVESKKRRCQLVIELRKDGMSLADIEEFVKFTTDRVGMAGSDTGKAADLQEELSSLQECVLHTFYEVERDLFTALRATNLADARDGIKNLYSKLQEGHAFIWRSLELIADKKQIIDSIAAIPVEQPADAPGDSTLKYHSLGDGGNLDASKEGDHNMHSDDSDEDSSSSDE
ncbi:hypothetical protein R1sor_003974 [Riccia sorocarpa]|uniref:Uncharacterized protein n=1 Tax=Riccia sorocarpa TaxID=122646 RepID=A0ABD3H372_9MARC